MAAVKVPEKLKPATLLEEAASNKAGAARGNMMLRADRRQRMNVGDPNGAQVQAQTRESEAPILVKIPEKVKAGGAKGRRYK
jgi:hypothetical protein